MKTTDMYKIVTQYLPYIIGIGSAIVTTIPVFFRCFLERDGHNVWRSHKVMGKEVSLPVLTKAGWLVGGFILLCLPAALVAIHKTEAESKDKEQKLEKMNTDLTNANNSLKGEVSKLKQDVADLRETATATKSSADATSGLVGAVKSRIERELPQFISGAINKSKDNIEREIRKGIQSAINSSRGQIEEAVETAVVDFQGKVTTIVENKVSEAEQKITDSVNTSQANITAFVKNKVKESTDTIQQVVDNRAKESVQSVANATKKIGNVIMGMPLRFEQKMPPRRLTGPLSDLFLKVENVSDDKPFEVHVLQTPNSQTHLACEKIIYDKTKNYTIYFQHPNTKLYYKIELTIIPQNGFLGFGGIDYLVAQSTEDTSRHQPSSICSMSTQIAIELQQRKKTTKY